MGFLGGIASLPLVLQPLLNTVRSMHRRVLVADRLEAVAWLGCQGVTLVSAMVLMDWLVRWPWPVRALLLVAALLVCVRSVRRRVRTHWLQAPSVQAVALRVERLEPSLAGRLASAVEFERDGAGSGDRLADVVVQEASDAWRAARPERHVRWGSCGRAVIACMVLMASGLMSVAFEPAMAEVGLRRTLTPWTDDRWPSRVELASMTLPRAAARGAAIEVRTRVLRGDHEGMRVQAACEVEDGGRRIERRLDLVRQSDGSFLRSVPAEGERMSVTLLAGDATSEAGSMRVVTAPSVTTGTLRITPPAYAEGLLQPLQSSWRGTDGGDHVGVLEGSEVEMEVTLAAGAIAPTAERSAWTMRGIGTGGQPSASPELTMVDPHHWRLRWRAGHPAEILLQPFDTDGVQAPEPARVAIRTMPDRPPAVSVTEPATDEIVTPVARVQFQVEARDDLSLAESGWRIDRQQRSGESAPVPLQGTMSAIEAVEATHKETLDLASLQARPGDVLLLRGAARDGWRQEDGSRREPVLSDPRRIQVVDAPTLERQVRQQVQGLREVVARLEQAQQDIVGEKEAAPAMRGQAGLGERIRQAQASATRLADRLVRNGLQEQALAESLQEASEAGQLASTGSASAAEALARAVRGESGAGGEASEAQAQVRDELRRMGEALDRNDRTSTAQRRAERLTAQIQQLRSDLREASRGSEGRLPEMLDADRRRALQDQAERQRTVASEVRSMLEELRDDAEKARSTDKAQARSMQQAAEEGEGGQASQRMHEAATRTERNQTTAADQAMQAAAEAMERVQGALREDRRARTEELKRRMASLIETLRSLRAQTDLVSTSITAWLGDRSLPTTPIETTLIQLARNTTATAEEAVTDGGGLRKAAGLVQRAAERHEAALTALRQAPVAAERAQADLERASDLLLEAIAAVEEAQRREDAKAAERERRQMSRTYLELATRVSTIRQAVAATVPPTGTRMDRRSAAIQREQGAAMVAVQQSFEQGPMSSPSLGDAQTFKAIHARVQAGMASAARSLQSAEADGSTVRALDQVVAALRALAQALQEPEPGQDPFMDARQGSSGAGAGASSRDQGLPPIAELRAVRELQAYVNTITRDLAESKAAGQSVDEALHEAGRLQDEVRRLGEDWIDRMEQQRRQEPQREAPASGPPLHGKFLQAASTATPSQDGGASGPDAGASRTPPQGRSLDDLLGIPGDAGSSDAAGRDRQEQLDRTLRREDIDDLAKSAMESMRQASRQMQEQSDGGLGTQRAQTRALSDLDALIDAATRFQKQQSSSASSSSSGTGSPPGKENQGGPRQAEATKSSQPSGQPQEPRGVSAGAQQGDASDASPPSESVVQGEGVLEEGRSEWGNLPPRIREILSQSRRDRVSALYQRATEAYYRRLAERRSP